jgi:hypothetical protein
MSESLLQKRGKFGPESLLQICSNELEQKQELNGFTWNKKCV